MIRKEFRGQAEIVMKIIGSRKSVWLNVMLFAVGSLSLLKADDIAFLYALDADVKMLRAGANSAPKSLRVGSRNIEILGLKAHTVYAAKMGAGCVETAATTQAVLTRFRCDYLVTVGPVGALTAVRKPGEWAVVERVTAYQRGTETATGFKLAQTAAFSVDSPDEKLGLWSPKVISEGRPMSVASGEVFCASNSFRSSLAGITGADVVDMNLFGLLTVSRDHGVPVIAWRVVSDRADENAADEFSAFTKAYRGDGGKWVAEWVGRLPMNPNQPRSYEGLRTLLEGP